MLDPEPLTRLDPTQALKHPWLAPAVAAAKWRDLRSHADWQHARPVAPAPVIAGSDDEMGSSEDENMWAQQARGRGGGGGKGGDEDGGCVLC